MKRKIKFKRILLKLSGEVLANRETGECIDPKNLAFMAERVKKIHKLGCEVGIVLGGGNIFVLYTVIVWASVLISAFIDNIPYVATMLPVVSGIAAMMGCSPTVLYFGLLTGSTLGGNLTPIGASANIATIGILQKEGHKVKTSDFLKIGVPFTLTAVTMGYLFIWFVWAGV